jgi:hypothetical protein
MLLEVVSTVTWNVLGTFGDEAEPVTTLSYEPARRNAVVGLTPGRN